MSYKIIRWELITSIASVVMWILLLLLIVVVTIKLNNRYRILKKIKCTLFYLKYDSVEDDKTGEQEGFIGGFGLCLIYAVITSITLALAIPEIVTNIADIINCNTFPEKIILEFIAEYMGT